MPGSCRRSPLDHPADDEAQTFYALALLGDLAARRRCGADSTAGRARLPRKCSRGIRIIPAPRITSCTPTIIRALPREACRPLAPTRRSRRRRATRSTCRRTRFSRPASGMKRRPATKRHGMRRSRGRSGAASRSRAATITAWRGCSTSGRNRDGFRRRRKRSRLSTKRSEPQAGDHGDPGPQAAFAAACRRTWLRRGE